MFMGWTLRASFLAWEEPPKESRNKETPLAMLQCGI